MAEYIIAYHGGKQPDTPEEGAAHMAKWQAWMQDLGEAMVNPGTPLGKSVFIDGSGVIDGAGREPLTGYSIVRADDLEAATKIAAACPFCDIGTVELAEVKSMGG